MGKWDDLDDFWSLDRLVPKRKNTVPPFSTKEKTVSVYIDSEGKEPEKKENKLSFDAYIPEDGKRVAREKYSPCDNKLIKSVEIIPSVDRFDFFDTFRKAALIYYEYKCERCDFTPFYSYKPQYSQMNTEQKKYYFYWRYMLRNKKYIKTDYSYVYLYVYEILNLPDKIGREEGLSLLLDLWIAYRKQLPKLDISLAAWVRDYCLLYKLPCPLDRIGDFLFDVISVSDFKEFYLAGADPTRGSGTAALIAYLSDYDWRRSRYATSDNSGEYSRHLEGAMSRIFSRILKTEKITDGEAVKISATAFPGSLCTHSVKCLLNIEYYPLSGVPHLRAEVTAALKYTENKLRAMLGVKSRLAVKDLPEDFKWEIDLYFDSIFAKIRKEKEKANIPEYQKLYDAPTKEISYEDAVMIEKSSWDVTARLVEDSAEGGEYVTLSEDITTHADKEPEELANRAECESIDCPLTEGEIEFIRLLHNGDEVGAIALLKDGGMDPVGVTERINEYFYDYLGDIVIEETEDFYKIIEDYTEEIENWISGRMK